MEFSDWLTRELGERGWSNSELARRAGVVPSTVSMAISERNQPGEKLCRGIAHAFGIPPIEVFQLAGILPRLSNDSDFEGLGYYFDQLTPRNQNTLLIMARALYEEERKEMEHAGTIREDVAKASS